MFGDCLERMKEIPDNSIDLVVTSPPYDNLRTYKESLNWNFEIFQSVANELKRVIKEGGVIVWVVGDATVKGSETGSSFKQALYFKEIGLNLHDTMIYAKKAPVPLTHNRYEQQFEYMFVISKGKPKNFNPILEDCISFGKTNHMTHRRFSDDLADASGKGKPVKKQRIKYNIWYYQKGEKVPHPAIFPNKLAHDHIVSWSSEGDTVLDPFMGSGTTGKQAKLLKRNFIGIECVEEYFRIAKQRIRDA